MPEQTNPYADPMNQNGFVPNYAQQGFIDGNNPYAQPGAYGQDPYGAPMGAPGYPGMPQEAYGEEFISPENMQSAQDIYANQAAQMGIVPQNNAYGAPYGDPNAQFGQDAYGNPYADPNAMYGNQPQFGNPNAPYVDQNGMYGAPQMPYPDPNAPYGDPALAGMPYQQNMYGSPAPGQFGAEPQEGFMQDPSQMAYPYGDPNAAMMGAEAGMQPGQMPQQGQGHMPQGFPGQGQPGQGQPGQGQPGQEAFGQDAHTQQALQEQIAKQQAEQALHEAEQAQAKRARQQAQQAQQIPQPAPIIISEPMNPALATNGKATIAFIFGILSIIFALIPPIGIILAVISIKTSKKYVKNGGRSARADIGRIFGYVGMVFSIIMAGVIIWFIGYVFGDMIGTSAYLNPITYFNNSPLGAIIKVPA